MRLFVATWLPEEVRAALRSLARPAHPDVRWMPEDSWHVTLRFLGEVGEPDPVVAALRDRLPGCGARTATLGGVTSRLGAVLVVRVDGLGSLAAVTRRATVAQGEPHRSDPFVGHVTVARPGRAGVPDDLVGLPLAAGPVTWSVDEVALVASAAAAAPTGSSATRYETLATVSLT